MASSDLVHRFEAAQRAVDMLITGYVTDADGVARELLEVLGTPAVLYRCARPHRETSQKLCSWFLALVSECIYRPTTAFLCITAQKLCMSVGHSTVNAPALRNLQGTAPLRSIVLYP